MPEHITVASNPVSAPQSAPAATTLRPPVQEQAGTDLEESTVQISAEARQRLNAEQNNHTGNTPANPSGEVAATETIQAAASQPQSTTPPNEPQLAATSGAGSERQLVDLYA